MAPIAPSTRANQRLTPPLSRPPGFPATTRRRMRFFDAFDRDSSTKSHRQIARENDIPWTTAYRWMRQRETMGSLAMRQTRRVSKSKLGRPSKVTPAMCAMLVNPAQNPVRDQLYEAQIEFYHLPVQKRQLQRKIKEHTRGGRRYKMAFVKKQVSKKNKEERVEYGKRHAHKTIEDFWSCITFTDEAHIDLTSQAIGDILREEGTRYDDENIMERRERRGACHGNDQGFCPTPAVAFEALEPPFVYKPRCPSHPLKSTVFVLSIQSVRLIGFPDITNTYKFPGLPLPAAATMGDTTPNPTASAAAPSISFSDFVSALNNVSTTGSIFPCLRSAATSSALLAAAFQQHSDIAYQEFRRLWELSTDTANTHVQTLASFATAQQDLTTAQASLLASQQSEHDCQDQISTLSAENQALLSDKTALHTAIQALSTSARPSPSDHRTAPQTDPNPYTGQDPSLLPKFMKDIAIKLASNADWYPDEQSRMRYLVGRLSATAWDTIEYGILKDGTVVFESVEEIFSLLNSSYGDIDENGTAQDSIMDYSQDNLPLIKFLPVWHTLAKRSRFDDVALIALLRRALHPEIMARISFTDITDLPTSLGEYTALVRKTDAALRRVDPQYFSRKKTRPSIDPPTSAVPAPAPHPLPPTPSNDPMDLSIVWVSGTGRKPKTPEEKRLHRLYCLKHNLCLYCAKPDHRLTDCPTRPPRPVMDAPTTPSVPVSAHQAIVETGNE